MSQARAWILGFARMVEPAQSISVITDDPDDNRVLECAAASGSAAIITGDHDLLRLGAYETE